MVFMARCCRLVVSKSAPVEGICGSGGGADTWEGHGNRYPPDNKYRHNLPNETRRLTNMLLFNGDVEGRFATAQSGHHTFLALSKQICIPCIASVSYV